MFGIQGIFAKQYNTYDENDEWLGSEWAGILPDENGKVSGIWNYNYDLHQWEKEN